MRRTLIALISACLSYSLAVSATGDARDFPASWCRDNVYNASGNLGIEPAGVYSLTPEASDSDFAICPIFFASGQLSHVASIPDVCEGFRR